MLDDVYASLDKDKIKALSNYVLRNGQTFITTTSILEIPDVILKDALVIRIEKEKNDGRE
jgi:recombinational DNA repair ATPase RecF